MIYCTPYVVVNYMTFRNGMMGDLDTFIADLKEIGTAVKVAVNHKWANGNLRFSNIYGTEFAFDLHKHVHLTTKETWYDLSVWDTYGSIGIISGVVPADSEERQYFIKKVLDTSEEYTQGKIHCSDCGTIVNYRDVSRNRYFAGIYCNDCWERKWKAIEAKENYN